jgi:hypothetical protein
MPKLKLAFAYRGKRPGDVIDVLEQDVRDLVRAGIGHLEGAVPRLRLGHLPEVVQPARKAPAALRKPPEQVPVPEPLPEAEDAPATE